MVTAKQLAAQSKNAVAVDPHEGAPSQGLDPDLQAAVQQHVADQALLDIGEDDEGVSLPPPSTKKPKGPRTWHFKGRVRATQPMYHEHIRFEAGDEFDYDGPMHEFSPFEDASNPAPAQDKASSEPPVWTTSGWMRSQNKAMPDLLRAATG